MRLLSEPRQAKRVGTRNSIPYWNCETNFAGKKSYVNEISVWHVGCGKAMLVDVNYVYKHRIPNDHSFSNSVYNKKRI